MGGAIGSGMLKPQTLDSMHDPESQQSGAGALSQDIVSDVRPDMSCRAARRGTQDTCPAAPWRRGTQDAAPCDCSWPLEDPHCALPQVAFGRCATISHCLMSTPSRSSTASRARCYRARVALFLT
eukprot:scaffold14091_cov121-Isochrysis_galbana.AAC.11